MIGFMLLDKLLEEKVITQEQYNRAKNIYKSCLNRRKQLGLILIELGYIDKEKLIRYIELQTELYMKTDIQSVPLLGELLVETGEITEDQLNKALLIQEKEDAVDFGHILIDMNVIDLETYKKFSS